VQTVNHSAHGIGLVADYPTTERPWACHLICCRWLPKPPGNANLRLAKRQEDSVGKREHEWGTYAHLRARHLGRDPDTYRWFPLAMKIWY